MKCVLVVKSYALLNFVQVLSFEEMKGGGETALHKPVTCNSHPDETMKYYCHTCHVGLIFFLIIALTGFFNIYLFMHALKYINGDYLR